MKAPRKEHVGGPAVPDEVKSRAAWIRLEDQIDWYDTKSQKCQRWYKLIKVIQIVLAVAIPLLAQLPAELQLGPGTLSLNPWTTSVAGALIAVLEGVQSLNQFSMLWITYRGTAEHLKHEKFLFLEMAGPYRGLGSEEKFVVLAERVEEHVSTEHANWFNESKRAVAAKPDLKT
jgi:hypothetical protein